MQRILKGFPLMMLVVILLAGCGGAVPQYLAVGDQAPDFTLPNVNGGEVSLSSYLGDKPVLLYFSMADG